MPVSPDITRSRAAAAAWRLPIAAAAAALLLLAPLSQAVSAAPAQKTAPKRQKTTLMLNWLPGGAHVPFFFAQEAGFYEKEGLSVRILSARGSRAAQERMHGGKADFALSEATELFYQRAGGRDSVGVMVYLARSPNAIITLRRPDIRSLADLAGKRLAAPRASFPRVIFPQLRKGAHLDLTRLRWLDLAPRELLPALIDGTADAVASSTLAAYQYRAAARKRGADIRVFPYAGAGVNPYSLVIVSMDSVIAKDPALVERFTRATARAVAAALERPRRALAAFLKVNPTLGAERIGAEWRAAMALIYPPEARRAGLGRFEEGRLARTKKILSRVRNLPVDVPLPQLYTNKYVPLLQPRPGAL